MDYLNPTSLVYHKGGLELNINISNWLLENINITSLVESPIIVYNPSNIGIMPLAEETDDDQHGGIYSNTPAYNNTPYYNYDNYDNYDNYNDYDDYDNSVSIEIQPVDQTINENETAQFSFHVRTGGDVEDESYQWYYSTTPTGGGTLIPGAIYTYLKVTGTEENNGRYYYCKFTSDSGDKTSTRALLTVKIHKAYETYVAVGFQSQIPVASNTSVKTISATSVANTSLVSATSTGLLTGKAIGDTTATVTINGITKTIDVHVISNPLEALFKNLATVIRAKNKNSDTYYPNQLVSGLVLNTKDSEPIDTLENLLLYIATFTRYISDIDQSIGLYPYQFASKIAEMLITF